MKKKKIKDTTEIIKCIPKGNYGGSLLEIEREEYSRDSIDAVMGKLNRELVEFEMEYKSKPTLVIISRELEMFFSRLMNLNVYHQMIGNNDRPIYTTIIFGVNCITTPRLKGITFEIY